MSGRDRGQRRARGNPAGRVEQVPRPGIQAPDAPEPSLRDRLAHAGPAALALLPVRFFFGLTFLYAGIDKLVDPAFFDASNPASIVAQLAAFARVSPIAPLVHLVQPYAILVGALVAIAEIAIGLGALTGLAYRVAAVGGAVLSITFWLTASWATHPYYYGPDLPYAFGWIALAIAGHGDLLVPSVVRRMGMPSLDDWDLARVRAGGHPRGGPELDPEAAAARRLLLQTAALGAVALAVGSLAVPLRLFRRPETTDALGLGAGSTPGAAAATPAATPAGTPGGAAAGTTAAPFTPSGLTVASVASVDAKGAIRIRVPADAPPSLPAGDPAIIVKLQDGSYAAYDALCTHEGCKVGWDAQDGVMLCPCHGAAFDPNDHGAVLQGPTNIPLPELPLVIDHQAGTITLHA